MSDGYLEWNYNYQVNLSTTDINTSTFETISSTNEPNTTIFTTDIVPNNKQNTTSLMHTTNDSGTQLSLTMQTNGINLNISKGTNNTTTDAIYESYETATTTTTPTRKSSHDAQTVINSINYADKDNWIITYSFLSIIVVILIAICYLQCRYHFAKDHIVQENSHQIGTSETIVELEQMLATLISSVDAVEAKSHANAPNQAGNGGDVECDANLDNDDHSVEELYEDDNEGQDLTRHNPGDDKQGVYAD